MNTGVASIHPAKFTSLACLLFPLLIEMQWRGTHWSWPP